MLIQLPSIDFVKMRMGARFLSRLPAFFKRPLELDEARWILSCRFEQRQARFLALLRRTVFEQPKGPYLHLLDHAGCEYGDLVRLVQQDGVEGALSALVEKGVFLSVDEFKGRTAVRRGSLTIDFNPEQLRNPLAEFHVSARSSGSRGGSLPVLIDLSFVRECAVNTLLFLHARDGQHWLKADWEVPGAGARFRLLKYASFGAPPTRWFSQVDPDSSDLDPIFRWSDRAMRWRSRLAGVVLPGPIYAPVSDPIHLARWMRDVLERGQVPHLFSFPSSAVSLCRRASEAGISLQGAQLTIGGEPVTEARLATIREVGATALPRYGSMECGPIGYGCLCPDAADDVHLQHDLHALIEAGPAGEELGFPSGALFVSTLHPAAPFVMINVSMGDQAKMSRRRCGCPLQSLGWHTHLHGIRSYEKLTGTGMTFLDTDVIHVLEEVLPARFGGSPTDYQLVEQESEQGEPELRLLVHPQLGPVNTDEVAETFLYAIGATDSVCKMMESVLREADILKVVRRIPHSTRSGKILHLHIEQRAAC